MLEAYLARRAIGRVRRRFPNTEFSGPYEREGVAFGIWEEQWLWAHRELIRGVVLDMSTPRFFHEYVYSLPGVDRVVVSDLSEHTVTKMGHSSRVDVVGDFCAHPPPMPPESLDTVLCLSILEHCQDPQAMVTNVAELLRPNGVAFFWAPFAYIDGHLSPDYWRFGRDGHLYLADRAGLTVLETGQYEDIGSAFFLKYGWSAAATTNHRGVPVINWMICRR